MRKIGDFFRAFFFALQVWKNLDRIDIRFKRTSDGGQASRVFFINDQYRRQPTAEDVLAMYADDCRQSE